MKIFVTGVCGQLGHDVVDELIRRGHRVIGSDIAEKYAGLPDGCAAAAYEQLDITDSAAVTGVLTKLMPDAVVHCAAWTAVDAAEDEENRSKVYAINEGGTRNLAKACRTVGAKLLYISTDYIFGGQGNEPWDEDCEAFAPLNTYGDSKLKGELAVKSETDRCFIVRTAWVFGINGGNFVSTMLKLSKKYGKIKVVDDQIGSPTYCEDLARLISDMIESDKYGVYHATNSGGYISWYEFACEIFRQSGEKTQVSPVSTEEYGLSKAKRPKNSRLGCRKLTEQGFEPLPDWRDALSRYLAKLPQEV